MDIETPEVQFLRLMEALQSPVGFFFALLAVVALVALASSKRGRFVLIGGLLFFSPMMVSLSATGYMPAAISPLQQFRTYGRPICGGILLALLVPALLSPRGWRQKTLELAAFLYLVFELVYSARNIGGGSPLRGFIGGGMFLLIYAGTGFGLSRWLQDLTDVRALLRTVAGAGVVFSACTCLQLLVNRGAIIAGNRLYALTGNPQHAAIVLAICFVATAFLVAWPDEKKSWRTFWALSCPLYIVLLLWTGSRTGAMMSIIGCGLLFRRHIGRFFGFVLICAVLMLAVLQLVTPDMSVASTRVLEVSDTRTAVWTRMLNTFLENPMIGVPQGRSLGSENSFLLVAAQTGLVGLLPLLGVVLSCVASAFKLHRHRRLLREQSLLVDMVFAGMAMLLAGSMFEGYLMGTLTPPVFMVYIYLALLSYLVDAAHVQAMMNTEPALLGPYGAGALEGHPSAQGAPAM